MSTTVAKRWYGHNPIMKKVGLNKLLADGVINSGRSRKDGSNPVPTTLDELFRRTSGVGSGLIHPIYRFKNWRIKATAYDLLIPSLRLASMLLEDPSILPFFNGLLQKPLARLGDAEAEKLYDQELYVFDWITGNEDPYTDQLNAWKKMANLSKRIEFEVVECDGNAFMQTRPLPSKHPNYANVLIVIRPAFLDILSKKLNLRHVGLHDARSSPQDAYMRTQLFFAICLVHETVHALAMSNDVGEHYKPDVSTFLREWRVTHPNMGLPKEPFYRDYRITELGATLESVLFSGHIRPLGSGWGVPGMQGMNQLLAPWGLSIKEFPGAWHKSIYTGKERGTPEEWGKTGTWYAAIEQDYVRKLFSDRFWNEHVARAGSVAVFHPKKLHQTLIHVRAQEVDGGRRHVDVFGTDTPPTVFRSKRKRVLIRVLRVLLGLPLWLYILFGLLLWFLPPRLWKPAVVQTASDQRAKTKALREGRSCEDCKMEATLLGTCSGVPIVEYGGMQQMDKTGAVRAADEVYVENSGSADEKWEESVKNEDK